MVAGQLGDDLDAGAGADPGGSGLQHGGGVGEGANAARGLDAGTMARYAAEQSDVVGGGSSGGEAGAGFEEVGARAEREFGGAKFFFEGEKAGFEDNFDDGAVAVSEFDDATDILADSFVVGRLAGLEQANVEDHVDIMGAELKNASGFVALGGGEGGTQGEADDHADGDAGAAEGGVGDANPGWVDHSACEAVFGSLVTELEDLSARRVRFEQGMVEDGREVLRRRKCMCGEGCGVKLFVTAGERIRNRQRVQKLAPSAGTTHRRVTFYHTGLRLG
jgi:hypothetical protein